MCQGQCNNANLACGIDGTCRTACSATDSCSLNDHDCIQGTCVGEKETNWADTWGACKPIAGSNLCTGSDGATLTSCNIKKPGQDAIATCDSAALCMAGIATGTCGGKACNAGMWSCAGAVLEHCTADETGYDMMSSCASADLCTAGLAMAAPAPAVPMCEPPVCGAGSTTDPSMYGCKDGNLLTCSMGQQGFTPSTCNGKQCDPGQGACIDLKIDANEITRAQYTTFLGKNPALTSAPMPGCGFKTDFKPNAGCMTDPSVCDATKETCDQVPQVCVDWCDAAAYCSSVGERLCGKVGDGTMVLTTEFDQPGQSEWMNACSAGGQYTWSESNSWDMGVEGQHCNGSNYPAHNAGTPQPTAAGLAWEVDAATLVMSCHSQATAYAAAINMSGNVWEWENSCSKVATASSAGMGDTCLARGGSFNSTGSTLRCDAASPALARNGFAPDVGFRCCGGS